jgi:hypothetical protein
VRAVPISTHAPIEYVIHWQSFLEWGAIARIRLSPFVCVPQGACVPLVVSAPNSLDTINNPFGVGSYCKCRPSFGGHDCTARVFEFVRVNFLMEVGTPIANPCAWNTTF